MAGAPKGNGDSNNSTMSASLVSGCRGWCAESTGRHCTFEISGFEIEKFGRPAGARLELGSKPTVETVSYGRSSRCDSGGSIKNG